MPGADEILTADALDFLAELHERFDQRRRALLAARIERQARFDAGELPDFPAETAAIRETDWTVGPIPADLQDRRVEITGPTNAKMIINALNSGAKVFMADFEDATSPVWDELVQGQVNLRDRWLGRLAFTDPDSGKHYAIGDNPAVLMVRPRGWHLDERHLTVDGAPIAGALFDFGLYLFHNARRRARRRLRPLFLSAQARKPARSGAVERRLRLRRGAARARARDDQGDRADRDDPGRVRDGRDPLRAARQYRRPQLRPLGLYLQLTSSGSAARPTG